MVMAEQATVFIVEDEPGMRDSLSLLMKSVNQPHECYETGRAFLTAFDPGRPGCLVADVRMPGMSGLDLLEELGKRGSALPAIVITGHGDIPMAVRALRLGALEFLEKPVNDQLLLDKVNGALEVNARLVNRRREVARIAERLAQLTPREVRVLELIEAGNPNKAIASKLEISVKTVESLRSKVMRKMRAGSLAELLRMLFTHRLEGGQPASSPGAPALNRR
jgi:FixJ family two-component response regulator